MGSEAMCGPQADMSGETVRDLFARRQLRRTRQREAVYAALTATRTHPTAEDIHRLVKQSGQPISLATVYNTLDALTDAGLCRKIAPTGTGAGGNGGASFRYDADTSEHVHLITADGKVMDIPPDLAGLLVEGLPRGVLARIEARLGTRIGRIKLELEEARG
jgi:Fur family peroxide stress response transcriptional regulator